MPACCALVCALDAFCCDASWDSICAAKAHEVCIGCVPSSHDCLSPWGPGCTDPNCCGTVCAADPFCCGQAWDSLCVGQAQSLCCNSCVCYAGGCNTDCPPDFNFHGIVDGDDLGTLLGAWGAEGGCEDLIPDGQVNGADLGTLLGFWGPTCGGIGVAGCAPDEGCRGTIIEISGSGFGDDPDDICVLLAPQRLVMARVIRVTQSVITAEVVGAPPQAGPGVWMVAKAKGCSTIIEQGPVLSGATGAWGWSSEAIPSFFAACTEPFAPQADQFAPDAGDCVDQPSPTVAVSWSVPTGDGGDEDSALPFPAITLTLPANPCPGQVGWPLGTTVTLDVHFDRNCGGAVTHFDAFLPPMSVIVPAAPVGAVAANLAAALAGAFAGAQGGLIITSAGNTITISVGPGCKVVPMSVGGVLMINCP